MPFASQCFPLEGVLEGRKTAVARALNLLENRNPHEADTAAGLIEALTQNARPDRHVIGVTGPPGAGKSSLISRLIESYRAAGRTVGVLSVDPSSLKSGGALLGDRARILYDPRDEGLFIRSMAAGRHLGGLAWHTRHCLTLFEAVYERILIETVGVGQSETEIGQVADSILFLVQPGSGDSLQFMKAGIMEIPHLLVVNKADRKALALKAFNELQSLASLTGCGARWTPRLRMVSALEGWGHPEVIQDLEDHLRFLAAGDLTRRRKGHRVQWIYLMFRERFGSFGVERLGGGDKLLESIAANAVDNPFQVLQRLANEMIGSLKPARPAMQPINSG